MATNPRYMQSTVLAVGIAAALAFAGQANAAGFQLKENSVKSMGSAFAGTAAKTGDSSVVTNNPAVMTQFEGTTVQLDLTVIDLNYEFQGSGTDALGRPLTGSNGGNAGDVTPVPAFSVVHKLDNGVALGAMVSAPFGLKTEYDAGWVGRYAAQTSEVEIIDFTLSGAVDITDRFSVGLGVIASRADVTLSKAVDFGSLLAQQGVPLPFAQPQGADGLAVVQGDDNGFGYILGANLRPTDNLSIGVSYRSEIDYELTGTADWTVPDNVRGVFSGSAATSVLFQDGTVFAELTTPSILNIGAAWQVNDALMLSATYARTDWSSLREVRIQFDNPDPDSVEPFEWKDTYFAALGAEYKLSDSWKLRGGVAYDETPTSLEHRTPRLPDANRIFYSVGATWTMSDAFDVNFAYTRIEPRDPKIDTTSGGSRVAGDFDGNANLFGVSAQYRF
ncbi:OmpP1/FadL family transporter [Luteimonas terrae]|uniref:Long-chain fatty acid transport protein n=1 Tax=Luteimonas terrae TaxID=1530191 RepID=A0ABU1XT23_9GAMM|nr:outer membrane protein transport protein [Luteimonas terrae]MDR7191909.1 long-chain fatty acid transport protein [Luteimonas terrae]